jgi:hypothetical protein
VGVLAIGQTEVIAMPFPEPSVIASLRQVWTDRLVKVKPGARPELARFEGKVGRVVTVNFNGCAILDFADGAWYDLPGFAEVLEDVTDDAERKSYDASANSAQKAPSRQG